MFTLWTLIEASMLCLNAVCILHEERFLAKGKSIIVMRYQFSLTASSDFASRMGLQYCSTEFR